MPANLIWRHTVVLFFLVMSLVTAASAQQQPNILEDSSFEVRSGHGWGVTLGAMPTRTRWSSFYDSTTAADGQYSLKIPSTRKQLTPTVARGLFTIESKFYPLVPGRTYSLSLAMKADKPCNVEFGIFGHGTRKKDAKGRENYTSDERIAVKKAQLTTEWQRFSVSTVIPNETPGNLFRVGIDYRSDDPEQRHVWIDAVQLQEGEAGEYAPSAAVEIGFNCPVPGNIYHDNEPAKLGLVANATIPSTEPVKVNYQVTDLFDRVVDKGTTKVVMDGKKRVEVSLDLFAKQRGIFRILANVEGKGSPAELVYSVLPPNRHPNEKYEDGLLGTDCGLNYESLVILKRANFNWVITKTAARWNNSEPEKGKYVFYDDEIDAANKAGMNVLMQLLWTPPVPEWALSNSPQEGERTKEKNTNWDPAKKAAFLKDLSEWTYAIVSHYKQKGIKYYELTNEPYFGYTAQQVGEVYKAMYQAAKKADPSCICAANTDYRIYRDEAGKPTKNKRSYLLDTVQTHGLDWCDVISAHFYNNELAWFVPFGLALKEYGKEGWNTETGITAASFYKTLPTLEAVEQGDAFWPKYLRGQVLTHTDSMQKNVLLTISAGRMSRYFYYFSRFTNCSPSQPNRRGGSGKENVEWDSGLRPGGVAQSLASHFFEGAIYHSELKKDEKLKSYLFSDGKGTRGFMCVAGTEAKPLLMKVPDKSKIEFFDLMTNPVQPGSGQELTLTSLVTFFRSSLPPNEVGDAIKKMTLRESSLPAEQVWYGDFEAK